MAAFKFAFGALWYKPELVFGVDPDADGSDYKFVKAAADMAFAPSVTVVEREGLMENMTRLAHVMGGKGGTVTFKLEMKGSGTPAVGAAVAPEAGELLEAILGAKTAGVGDVTTAATVNTLTVANPGGFAIGMMVIVNCGAPWGYVPRFITNIAGGVLTLDRDLPGAPGVGAVVQASTMYHRTDTGHKSVAFAARRDGILYTFLGCKLDSLSITGVETQAIAMLELTFSVTDWNTNAKAQLPAAVPSGVTATRPPVIKGSCFSVDTTEELLYSLTLDLGLSTEFQTTTCGGGPSNPDTMNVGFLVTQSRPTGTFKSYYAGTHMTDYAAGTERKLAFAAGAGLGNAWGIYLPKCQLTAVAMENRNGFVGDSVNFAVNDNGTGVEYAICLA